MMKKVKRVRREQFIFIPSKEQAMAVHKLVKERQKISDLVSQGGVLRELVQIGLLALGCLEKS